MSVNALEFINVTKKFLGVVALKDVSFSVQSGSIHALMGENGAGKSTLLKTLGGSYIPEDGILKINDKNIRINSVKDSINNKIAIIYQELYLVPELTVYENVFLGNPCTTPRFNTIDNQKMIEISKEILAQLDDNIDVHSKVKNLSIGQQQLVEIAKSLNRGAEIFAFDEPTSSLSARETEKLFTIIRRLHSKGKTIIYVSHRMEEVFNLCNAITVFRDGEHIVTHTDLKSVSKDMIIYSMLGQELGDVFEKKIQNVGEELLKVEGLTGIGVPYPLSFFIKKGEVLGFYGLIGAGRSELMKLIYGATKKYSGKVLLNGEELAINMPKDAINKGIAYCSEDRRQEGIIPLFSISDNINLNVSQSSPLLNFNRESQHTDLSVKWLSIKTPSNQQQIRFLSGGNQQKCLLARWLSKNQDIQLIILDEPTRGIDIGAKKEIYRIISDLVALNKSVIVISSELSEIIGISDRIITMCENKMTAEFVGPDFEQYKILDASFAKEEYKNETTEKNI